MNLSRRTQAMLLLLVALHLALASWFALVTPYRQSGIILFQGRSQAIDIGAPDERQHANYIQHILDGKGIPVFHPEDPNLGETYQSHQPPLYYVAAAGFAKLLGVSNVETGRNLRFLNVVFGGLTVAGIFYACLWGFGSAIWALAAAAFASLLPMNLGLSGAVSNDPLLFCLATWGCAVLFRALSDGWSIARTVALAVLTGGAILTKTSGVALLAAVAFGSFWVHESRPCWGRTTTFVAVTSLLVLPWWARNFALYGDPLAMKAFTQAFVGSPQAIEFMRQVGVGSYWWDWVGWWTARSSLGVFGYMDVFLPEILYRAWTVVAIACLVLGVRASSSDQGERSAPRAALGALLAVVVVLFLRFNAQYFQGQARYLLPSLVSLSIFATGWIRKLIRPQIGFGVMVILLLSIDLYTLWLLPSEFALRSNP